MRGKFREIENKVIIKCPECPQKLRLPLFQSKTLNIKCPKCKTEFRFNYKRFHLKRRAINSVLGLLTITLFICAAGLPFKVVSKLTVALENVQKEYESRINDLKNDYAKKIIALKEKYSFELKQIDTDDYRGQLREKASKHYNQIWAERENYNARYAITSREKAQLEMLNLAKDRTKSIEEIIRMVAVKAAPKNSTINVYRISGGLRLDIDFDMSELTSGERGTRTKHTTIESLKREVIKLISKVTNDVYNFCQDLELATIAIGCRHFVDYEYGYGPSKDVNVVLYKVRLDKKDIKELKNNPFLDIYSTTKYFKIEKDDFPNLSIKRIS